MKKAIPVILGVVVLIAVALVVINMRGVKKEDNKAEDKTVKTDKEVQANLDLLAWLKQGESVECVLSTAEGEMTVKSEGDKVRIDGMPYFFGEAKDVPDPGYAIVTDDYSYFWSGNKGIKFNNTSMEEMNNDMSDTNEESTNAEDFDIENWATEMEDAGTAYECEKKRFSSTEFDPPAGVDFMDWTDSLVDINEMGQQMEGSMGEDGDLDTEAIQKTMEGVDTENLQQIMQGMDTATE